MGSNVISANGLFFFVCYLTTDSGHPVLPPRVPTPTIVGYPARRPPSPITSPAIAPQWHTLCPNPLPLVVSEPSPSDTTVSDRLFALFSLRRHFVVPVLPVYESSPPDSTVSGGPPAPQCKPSQSVMLITPITKPLPAGITVISCAPMLRTTTSSPLMQHPISGIDEYLTAIYPSDAPPSFGSNWC